MGDVPAIGDWLMPKDGSAPGMVVAVLPSGRQCILARRLPPHYRVVETVHAVADLKGPMNGKSVFPGSVRSGS
jgi:hypothetical protein